MPKKTVKVTIPINNVDELSELIKFVWKTHVNMGTSSPFHNNPLINMARYEELMNTALTKRKESQQKHHEALLTMAEARKAFGTEIGQSLSSEDTLYRYLYSIKHFLLFKHSANEERLFDWGFKVKIGL